MNGSDSSPICVSKDNDMGSRRLMAKTPDSKVVEEFRDLEL